VRLANFSSARLSPVLGQHDFHSTIKSALEVAPEAWKMRRCGEAVNCANFAAFLLRAEYPVLIFSQDFFGRE
jgi:hypothetical protein